MAWNTSLQGKSTTNFLINMLRSKTYGLSFGCKSTIAVRRFLASQKVLEDAMYLWDEIESNLQATYGLRLEEFSSNYTFDTYYVPTFALGFHASVHPVVSHLAVSRSRAWPINITQQWNMLWWMMMSWGAKQTSIWRVWRILLICLRRLVNSFTCRNVRNTEVGTNTMWSYCWHRWPFHAVNI